MNPVFKVLSSLRLTVILLVYSVLLIFLGSLAQVHEGLWQAQVRWFQSWWVLPRETDAEWLQWLFHRAPLLKRVSILPAGHTVGVLLIVNLLAAHIKRFTWNFQKFGIQLTHFGVVVMLVGQLISDERKVESFMNFTEGESKNYTEHHRDAELVFLHDVDPKNEEAVSFPEAMVLGKGTLKHPNLPFTVSVLSASKNGDVIGLEDIATSAEQLQHALDTVEARFSSAEALADLAKADTALPVRLVVWRKTLAGMGEKDPDISVGAANVAKDPARAAKLQGTLKESFREQMLDAWKRAGGERAYAVKLLQDGKLGDAAKTKAVATHGYGTTNYLAPLEEMTDDEKGRNLPWAIVEITTKEGGTPLGRWLVSTMSSTEQSFEAGGQKWRMALRFERYYLPFSITLVHARQDTYIGTQQAKEFASEIRVKNPATGEDRPVQISMNYPLRYGGLTFYQNTMGQGRQGLGVAAFLEAYTGRPREDFMERERSARDRTSGLQVVENPSMLAPYSGCIMVGFGMLWQFLLHLTAFLAKRVGLPSPSFGVQHPLLPYCAMLIVVPDIFLGVVAAREGTLFILAVLAVTPLVRCVLAHQVWKGRFHVFSMVFLLVATVLMLVFAIKYHQEYGRLLWPIVSCQLAAFIGLAYIVFGHLPQEKAASHA